MTDTMTDYHLDIRKKEVIDSCLDIFINQGLSETSVRDLSSSIHLQAAGIYSYFSDKNRAVVECAEEAVTRIEKNLIMYAVKEIDKDPDHLIKRLFERADRNAATMRFFAQVYSTPRYSEQLKPAIERLSGRYGYYISRCSEKLKIDSSEFAPLFYTGLSAYLYYMLFGNKDSVIPQINLLKTFLTSIQNNQKQGVENNG